VGRQHFEVYLARMGKYKDLMLEIIREHGLPEDLVYLPLIESGYNPGAYSYARAMGPWQFISSTGRLYGLKRNWWYDERRDFVKSTHAACRYLKFLYEKFGCWKLALAAYNGGEGRVSRTIKRQKTDDFWKLRLKRQTRNYVPLYMAATMIAKDPDKYGYGHVQQMEPLRFDVVAVDKVVELKKVASALGVNLQSIKELNPELMRGVTPPSHGNYQLRIPAGFSDKFNEVYASIPKEKYTDWVVHRVRRGEALSTIAQAYGVRLSSLKSANRIGRSNRIYAGQKLIIPVPQGYKKRNVSPETVNSKPANTAPPRTENGVYTVKRGDNLWDISRKFNTDVDDIKDTNNLRGRNPRLYPGDKLVIPGSEKEGDEESVYVVKQGDSLWSIAKKFNTTVSAIRKWNNLPLMKLIMPGDRLIVSPPG
jgi:membrane-bound lytic murein transglycosylase D